MASIIHFFHTGGGTSCNQDHPLKPEQYVQPEGIPRRVIRVALHGLGIFGSCSEYRISTLDDVNETALINRAGVNAGSF